MVMIRSGTATLLGLAASLLLASCQPAPEPPAPEVRPVRVVNVEKSASGETVSLTGTVQAKTEVNLAFRIDGRIIERPVNVGDQIKAGQLVAALDPQNEQSSLQSARANLAAARGQLTEARDNHARFRRLVDQSAVSRAEFDRTTQLLQTAQSQMDSAVAQVNLAENRLSYTQLFADAPGAITARGAEPGEVVQAGRMIVQVAREGGRDAVFDVPARVIEAAAADAVVTVALTTDPSVVATGRVREVSPQADPVTRTFQIRVGLTDPPEAMRLGSTVTGSIQLGDGPGIRIPASALTSANGSPAVWIVDPATNTVSLQSIEVLRYGIADVSVTEGLAPLDLVVTAGVQALRPGQKVRLLQTRP
jgi:RND family efflux transporter MFP subunit